MSAFPCEFAWAINSSMQSQPSGSSLTPITSGRWRRTKLRNLLVETSLSLDFMIQIVP